RTHPRPVRRSRRHRRRTRHRRRHRRRGSRRRHPRKPVHRARARRRRHRGGHGVATHFLLLKLSAARNTHRRRPAALIGLLIGAATLTAATLTLTALLGRAANATAESGTVYPLASHSILLGSAITALTLLLPLLLGPDDRND